MNISQILMLIVAILLMGGLVFQKKVAAMFNRFAADFREWLAEAGLGALFTPAYSDVRKVVVTENSLDVYAEDEAFERFRAEFRVGPTIEARSRRNSTEPVKVVTEKETSNVRSEPVVDPLQEFFAWVPQQVQRLRELHQEISRSGGDGTQEKLTELWRQIDILLAKTCEPELAPVRQMATALEGLAKHLSERVREVTPSTLRTLASGIDLLGDLCRPDLRADFAINPPIRILAVDDDAVSRFAITFAIKKAFDKPDLAEDGPGALKLVSQHAYDVIFLDVQMPGMDGFELCSKIHETDLNRITPVVFVTNMKDFDARAKSIVSGGSDLVGKPFLPFEMAVKALTLVLRRRLQACGATAKVTTEGVASNAPSPSPGAAGAMAEGKSPVKAPGLPEADSPQQQKNCDDKVNSAAESAPSTAIAAVASDGSEKSAPALLPQVAASLEKLGKQIGECIDQAGNEGVPPLLLMTAYLESKALTGKLTTPGLRPASQMASALEALLKKLHEKPKNVTAYTLQTALAAVQLLKDLCVAGVDPDLAAKPAISILVVDDEPLTRRAIVGALQVAFLKPDGAADGEAALILAEKKPFDVIFMDVQMPGMDGFTACVKIHETAANRNTPVLFVTSQTDEKSRARSELCGGSDFVTKPFIFVEITVKALTYALRGRLTADKQKVSADIQSSQSTNSSTTK